jgi:GNAT superfamily N-acetyltransferase
MSLICKNEASDGFYFLLLERKLVKENNRRQSLGEALLKAAIQKCRTRNIRGISLLVDLERTAAMNLYKKLGSKVHTLIQDYYSQDQNAYRMYIDFVQISKFKLIKFINSVLII